MSVSDQLAFGPGGTHAGVAGRTTLGPVELPSLTAHRELFARCAD